STSLEMDSGATSPCQVACSPEKEGMPSSTTVRKRYSRRRRASDHQERKKVMIQLKKSAAVETYRLSSSFDAVRKVLLESRFADGLPKPLAYWALPNDRRLPLAFPGRTLDDLLATPFEQLSATPGIGQKKITSLVRLLHRATRDEPPAVPFGFE